MNWQFRWWLARVAPDELADADADADADAAAASSAGMEGVGNGPPPEAGSAEAQRAAMLAAAARGVQRNSVRVPSPEVEARRMTEWHEQFADNKFWAFVGHSDNATHFKSGKMMHYWSTLNSKFKQLKHGWIYFGCPGHGKGPWDGFGAVVKQRNKRDTKNGTFHTTSGEMKNTIDVAGVYNACPSAAHLLLTLARVVLHCYMSLCAAHRKPTTPLQLGALDQHS